MIARCFVATYSQAASTRDDIIRAAMENRLVPGSSQTTLDDDRGVRPDDWIVSAKSGNRGIVRYVGHTAFASGVWLGIELEAPAGKHDGLVRGMHTVYTRLLSSRHAPAGTGAA